LTSGLKECRVAMAPACIISNTGDGWVQLGPRFGWKDPVLIIPSNTCSILIIAFSQLAAVNHFTCMSDLLSPPGYRYGALRFLLPVNSSVIDELEHLQQMDGEIAVAYMYLDAKDPQILAPQAIFQSIIRPICSRLGPQPVEILRLWSTYGKTGTLPPLDVLINTFRSFVPLFSNVRVCIDAYDTLSRKSATILGEALLRLLDDNFRTLRIFVTSRLHRFDGFLSPQHERMIYAADSRDIRMYVEERISLSTRLRSSSPDVKADMARAIADGADGM
jgi:hypothetical protein